VRIAYFSPQDDCATLIDSLFAGKGQPMHAFKKFSLLSLISGCLLTCAVQAATLPQPAPADPENLSLPAPELAAPSGDALSGFNRVAYHFNDTLDKIFLKPTASLYNKLVPRPLHQGITNIFVNIDTIPTIINDVLQIKVYYAVSDSWRLFINSTIGILGFFDVASKIGLKPHHEDFGLTLARWGYTNSNYLVIPFFGPGTIRDILGWPVDYFYFSIYPHIPDTTARYVVYGVGVVDRRANLLQYQDVFEQVAVDRYSFMRNAYLQHRKFQIEENRKSSFNIPEAPAKAVPAAGPQN
jgi:phospholipid-binding lipoprotein MlaA